MLPKPQDLKTIIAEFKHGKSLRDALDGKRFQNLMIMIRVSDMGDEVHRVEDAFLQVEALSGEPPRYSYYLDGNASQINSGKLHDIHSPGSSFEFDPERVWDFVTHNMQAYLRGAYTYMRQRKP